MYFILFAVSPHLLYVIENVSSLRTTFEKREHILVVIIGRYYQQILLNFRKMAHLNLCFSLVKRFM